ncbi:MAG TPA: 30S ribosomal protein S5 [Candidatus Paceibacterota bacterium]
MINTEEQKVTEEVKKTDGPVLDIPQLRSEPAKNFTRTQRPERKKNPRKISRRKESRVRPEFDHKLIDIRRVTRVVAGGRRFSFSVTLAAGNHKGSVGVGQGKAGDTPLAIEKALRDAKKNMIQINLTKENSIPHETEAKFGASEIYIKPALGRGVLAGSSARIILELAGLTGINAKILSGSKNKTNNAKATIKALASLSSR